MFAMAGTSISCGVQQLYDLDIPSVQKLLDIAHTAHTNRSCGCLVFSDRASLRNNYGPRVAKMIEKEGIGTITESARHRNPNSGNQIKVWVWVLPTREQLDVLAKAHNHTLEYHRSNAYDLF